MVAIGMKIFREDICKQAFVGAISVAICAQLVQANAVQQYAHFNKVVGCKLRQRLNNGSAYRKAGEFPSLVKCAADCLDNCCGVSVGEHGVCYHHVTCKTVFPCLSKEPGFELYMKDPCEHKGIWDNVRFDCKCVGGWVGDRCERYPRNCKEMATYGYEDSYQQLTILQPEASPVPFAAYCSYYRDKKEFFTYIMYNNGTYDNTLTWSDYVHGFRHDNNNYWLGLDKMKILSDAGQTAVFLRARLVVDGRAVQPSYSFTNFRLSAASEGYIVNANLDQAISGGGVYSDCLTPVFGAPFSTADHDQDLDSANCAREGKAGWWFTTCDGCNPLGPRTRWRMTPDGSYDDNVIRTYMYFKDA